MNDDLYLLDIESKSARFITDDEAIEEFQSFSPDDSKIAYVKNHDIHVYDIASATETRITDNGGKDELWNGVADWVYEEELNVQRSFWWSPNSDTIAFLQFDTSPIEYFYLIDHLDVRPKLEKQKFAMTGGNNSIVKLGFTSSEGGPVTWVDTGPEKDYYIYDADWNTDGSALLYRWMNRAQQKLELRFADPETGESTSVVSESRDTWVNSRIVWIGGSSRTLVFLKDNSFLWASDRSGFFHIYHISADGNVLNQLTSGDWQVEDIQAVSEDGQTIYFTATEASPLERNLYRVNLDGTGFTRITTEDGNNAADTSPHGRYSVVTNSAIDRQRKMSVISTAGKELAVLVDNENPRAENYSFNYTKLIEIEAEDGETLYGMITLPPDFDENHKYPVIVYVYGGPAVQLVTNSWSIMALFLHQLNAARDYIIFTLDNRGSWGRGHEFESKIYLKLGDWELRDQIAGVKYLHSLPYVDPDRIGITGGSFGGFMTLIAMFRAPEYFKVGVAESPGVDNRHYDTIYTERYLSTPQKNPDGYKASDASQYAGGLQGKLLITHGMMDNNAHVQQTFQLIEALITAGKEFDIMLYPKERHGLSLPHHRRYNTNLVNNFFARHLKGEE
jgi:dipeptidyl-peptidase-4